MRILAPLAHQSEVLPLIEAGATELYAGIIPDAFSEKYSFLLNRRPNKNANFRHVSALAEAVSIAHAHQSKIFVTLNGLYIAEQYEFIQSLIVDLIKINIDGVIVADLGCLFFIRECFPELDVHIGTCGSTFNSHTAKFYQKLGAKEVTVPRHLTVSELCSIVQNSPNLTFSVFVLYETCPYIDGFCTMHGPNDRTSSGKELSHSGPGCAYFFSTQTQIINQKREKIKMQKEFQIFRNGESCGVCALYDFKKAGVQTLKIVGRNRLLASKVLGVKYVKTALQILEQTSERPQFIRKMQELYQKTYSPRGCTGFSCYYPSVFTKKEA